MIWSYSYYFYYYTDARISSAEGARSNLCITYFYTFIHRAAIRAKRAAIRAKRAAIRAKRAAI